jgi:hypothetical protein
MMSRAGRQGPPRAHPTRLQLLFQEYPPTQAFAVVSWGCAATAWLAKTLNSHPDLFCVHALRAYWVIGEQAASLDDVTYLHVIASQGHAHKAAGDVHGIDRASIPALRQAFGPRFNAVVVVRAPEPRLYSQLALFAKYQAHQSWDTSFARRLIATHRLRLPAGTYEEELFVHGVNMLNAIVEEQAVGTIYRCEDLTSQAETLGRCIEEVTRGVVCPTRDWLRGAVRSDKINPHRRETQPPTLTEWQLEIIHKIVTPLAWDYYVRLGYTLPAWHKP